MKSIPIIIFGIVATLVASEAFAMRGSRFAVPEPQPQILTGTLSIGTDFAGLADSADVPSPAPRSATPAYLLTIFLGFGIGHFYLGAPHAVTYLVLDGIGVAGLALGGAFIAASEGYHSGSSLFAGLGQFASGAMLISVSGVYLLVVRILEVVDVFRQADHLRQEGKVASVQVQPVVALTADSVSTGLRVAFK